MPPASSLQASWYLPVKMLPIIYLIKKTTRYCSPLIKLSFTVSKKVTFYTLRIRARGLHSPSSSSFYLLPPTASSHLQSGESVIS